MRTGVYLALAAVVAIAAPAEAKNTTVNVAGGRAGDVAIALARQTGTSIVVADRAVADRRVPAIRGTFGADEAVQILARAAGAKALPAGREAWRLVAAPLARPTRPRPAYPQRSQRDPELPPRDTKPEEIVVAGSKRDIPLADYPGQVEMLDGKALTFGGVGGTEKVIQRVTSVSSTYLGSGRNKLFIRGIADSSFTGPTQSTVGQYLGDLRLSYNAPDPDLRLSDLARVEVLEGPQGTLYGAGSLGGILRLVPNPPEMGVAHGGAIVGGSATQHGAFGGDASATINLPLADEIAALRVTVDAETQGGYIDKPLLDRKDVNRTDILGGRAAVRFNVGSGWTVDLIGVGQTTAGRDSQYADRNGPPLTRAAPVKEGFDADYAQGQIVVSGHLGDVRFRSSTGITGQSLEERYDATLAGQDPRLFVQSNHTRMIANESRIWRPLEDRLGWLLGASFTHNRTTLKRKLGPPNTQAPATGVENGIDEATLYGEASIRLTDWLIASGGARFTNSRLSGQGEDVAPALALALASVTAKRNETALLPSASLSVKLAPDTTAYVRYQEGFRPGGLAISGDFVSRFRRDRVSTIEFGARHGGTGTTPFEIAANISYTRWNDIQADYVDSSGLPSTANIGDGRIWSASVTGSFEIGPWLRLNAGMTYNDSRVVEPVPQFAADRAGQIPNIANFSGRIGLDYQYQLKDDLVVKAQGWAQYVGKSRLGVGPELGELQGDYLDSGLTVRLGKDEFGVTLSLTNLTDEKGNRFALGTPFAIGRQQITPLRPRTLRIGFDASF